MSVQSVERIFAIIEIMSKEAEPLQLTVIAKECQLPPSTTHRLLETLCNLGYAKCSIGGFYSLTPRLFNITSNAFTENSLFSVVKPHLDELSDLVNETVLLVLCDSTDVVYVYKNVKSIGSIQMGSRIGKRIPMHRTAAGKAILSDLSEAEVRHIFSRSDIRPATNHSITDVEELLCCLEIDRRRGYSMDNEENELGITCIGMTLGKPVDGTQYAFSVSSLTSRMLPDRVECIVKAMKRTQSNILNEWVDL